MNIKPVWKPIDTYYVRWEITPTCLLSCDALLVYNKQTNKQIV